MSLAAMRKVERARAALANALLAAADEYANGGNRAEPIVRRHFTAGNAARYGWPPLSPAYARAKAGGEVKTPGGVAFLDARQRAALGAFMSGLHGVAGAARRAARAAKVSELRGGRAASRASKATPGLPVLVRSGRLRDAVSGGRATVAPVALDRVVIRWSGLPPYATWHQEGTPRMPRRSPIDPNAEDRQAIIAAARRYLSAAMATARAGVAGMAAGAARLAP